LDFLNDDTVEGASVLMNKVGYIIDEKIYKFENYKEKSEIKQKKNEKTCQKFHVIFKRFEELAESTALSQRVRMLIKNLIQNRASGWEKTKKANEAGPKKIEELRRDLERKAREEEQARMQAEMEEQSYLESEKGYYGKQRGGQRSNTYYKKKESFGGDQMPAQQRDRRSIKN
jgi:hypothetical protein